MRLSLFLIGISFLGFFSLWAFRDHAISSISWDEYEVYSAFFSQWHFDYPPVDEPGEAHQIEVEVIGMTMSYDSIHRGDDKAAKIGPSVPPFRSLESSIFYDYESKADALIDFKCIDAPSNVIIEAIDDRYDYSLSRIGFNKKKDVATFLVTCPNIGGTWFVFKFQEGRWQLVEEVTAWVE